MAMRFSSATSAFITPQRHVCGRCLGRLPRWSSAVHGSNTRGGRQRQGVDGDGDVGAGAGVLAVLEERGYVNQIAGDRTTLDRLLRARRVAFYAGIDPTAPSLHLGHLLPLMVLFWLYHHGHHVVSLVGGATARVGDPSGRLTSRTRTAASVHETNSRTMSAQLSALWETATQYGHRHGHEAGPNGKKQLLDNAAWLGQLNILDFLGRMGNGMRLGAMLGRDTVRNKMERGDGMSFSEFTYPLLQAWDWWHMFLVHGVQVQIGGSDQYGNIIAGMDAVKHIAQNYGSEDKEGRRPEWLDGESKVKDDMMPMGLTVPLLTTASGEKFGKSAGNAIWLDRSLTSAFDLYGLLLRSPDEDVERYLKLFTFLPIHEIASVMAEHTKEPGTRKAQHLLASEVLELVHGREEAMNTREKHQALRAPSLSALRGQNELRPNTQGTDSASAGAERTFLPSSLVLNTPFSRILYHARIAPTKSEGARMIAKGGVYAAAVDKSGDGNRLDFVQLRDQKPSDVAAFAMDGMLVLRVGKWKVRVVDIVEDAEFDARKLDAPGWEEWKAIRS